MAFSLHTPALVALSGDLRAVLDNLRRHYSGSPPPILYHYTDAAGFLGILTSQHLRASDVLHMNDPDELAFGRRVFSKLDASFKDWFPVEFIEHLPVLLATPSSSGSVFAACASTEWDSLPQWRGYAGNGLGYGIGIKTDRPLEAGVNATSHLVLWQVIYGERKQAEIVEELRAGYEAALTRFRATVPDVDDLVQAGRVTAFSLSICLSELTCIFKNQSFEYEHEWRWVFQPNLSGLLPPASGFRASAFGLTSFIELHGEDSRIPIAEVILGPRIDDRTGDANAASFLVRKGYSVRGFAAVAGRATDVVIRRSRASYRAGGL